MTTAAYFDPDHDVTVDAGPVDERHATDLIDKVMSLSSGRGIPAVEFVGDDGTSLSIATDGMRAFLVWKNSLGETFHSVGGAVGGGFLVFDYFGSWSEVPDDLLVPLADAVDSVNQYLGHGVPDTERVIFSPD
jgi:hypothetical protein